MSDFLCQTPGRRTLLLAQTTGAGVRLDGIDLLAVLDDHDGPLELRQRLLLVRLHFGDDIAGLNADNVAVSGGVRVQDPQCLWAGVMAGLSPAALVPALDAAEQAWLAATIAATDPAVQARTLVVSLDRAGDFSTYSLSLQPGSLALPSARSFFDAFDRRSLEVDFSFKVECPTPFDCEADADCETEPVAAPEIDYLTRDFPSFRRLMFDRMSLLEGTDGSRSPATLRSALVDVLAYAADRVAFHQDAVATEAFLGTARKRRSVRRHARLLDYAMHEGCNARAPVHLTLAEGLSLPAASLRRGAPMLTRVPDADVTIDASGLSAALATGPLGFELLTDAPALSSAHNEIALHTWGDDDCCLRAGATSAWLVDDDEELALDAGDLLLLEQVRSPTTGRVEDAAPDARWVLRLESVGELVEDLLLGRKVRQVSWQAGDALPRDVAVSGEADDYLVARANLVLAHHAWKVPAESLSLATAGHDARVSATLSELGLTWSQPIEGSPSATALLRQDPRAALPMVELSGEDETWTPARDLLASAQSATEFAVEMESDRRAWLRFGDDTMGRRPNPSSTLLATYRVGNGRAGNVGAEAIAHLLADLDTIDAAAVAAVVGVRNPLAASGGTEPERIDEVKLYAPQAFRVQQRAVTEADWAEVAARHPRIARAVARLRWTGSWHTVFLYVDYEGGISPSAEEEDELLDYLDAFRMAGTDLELSGPQLVPLDIALSVCVEQGALPEHVEAELLRVLGSGRLPDGRKAFFHPDRFTFGQPVYLSELISWATAVPGVRWLDHTPPGSAADPKHRFKRLWAPDDGSLANGLITLGDLEIARCESDPSFPENGRLQLFLRGGS